ncbi:hypothetical protein VP01_288g8 [Puccinia sorghi]|uniref:NADPH-dependent diflavin oxidoreductase 1 n=1 Tax=Puccinia sorghi TaxID=27349 RepID=A0A0L6V1K6_9BASI|nr:hypothetical protein VP01_288g8 [Puccinia sorghi]
MDRKLEPQRMSHNRYREALEGSIFTPSFHRWTLTNGTRSSMSSWSSSSAQQPARRANLPVDFIDNIHFTIFGLGDSSYPKFNWAAKKLYRRLSQLGAQPFYERGEADDQNRNGFVSLNHYRAGIDSTLLPWLEGLWKRLMEIKPLPHGLTPIPPTTCLPPSFRLEHESLLQHPIPSRTPQTNSTHLDSHLAILTKNQRLTAPVHWQDTRHIELEFDETLQFDPGSVCEILPENSPEDVDKLFKLMKWSDLSETVYKLTRFDPSHKIPDGWARYTTLKEIFTTRLDLTAVPGRSFIDWLSHFTRDPIETERLQEFCSIDGQVRGLQMNLDDLFEYARRPRRTILEVLSEFKSASIPLDYIHDVFPQIRPRQFSIASSPKVIKSYLPSQITFTLPLFPNQIHLLVAVVNYKTRLSVPRKGLCTSWLSNLQIGTKIAIRITGGYVKFPKDPQQTVICIGPGTGIAPFRSLIQDRSSSGLRSESPSDLVIFGCRSQSKDFYYSLEWARFVDDRVCKFLPAYTFSLPSSLSKFPLPSLSCPDKRYVQHLIEENSALVWQYMTVYNAWIIISGSAGEMPKSVRSALKNVCVTQGGLDQLGADELVGKWETMGRLQEDTWS